MNERPDDIAIETTLGPQLVARLYGLLKAVRLYDVSNQAVQDQMRDLLKLIEDLMDGELVLVAMGQCFYVNGVRVRAEASQVGLFDALTQEFERRRLGGIRFLDGLVPEELGAFMKIMLEHAYPSQANQFEQMISGAGLLHVVPVTLEELKAMSEELEQQPTHADQGERERAKQTFQRAVRGTRAAILRTARTGRPAVRGAKRLVHPIVDSVMKHEYSLVGLTAIKDHDEYTYAHCVNVSILSVAMGQALGLPRPVLANLGVAALLHDVGKLAVPTAVLGKPSRLTDEEWALMHRHPLEGLLVVTRMPGLSDLTLDSLNVCMHHHLTMDGGGYPRIEGERYQSILSRIVSVADCFDAMTAHRAYRKRPFTGYEALRQLIGPERSHFDPAVLWALTRTVGIYPAGAMLLTQSRHLVLSVSTNPSDLRRPHCRVLARPDGSSPPEDAPEYWNPMPASETVARVVSPEEYEAEVDRLLAA